MRWWGWLGRFMLATVFVLGTLTSAGSKAFESGGELTVELGEEDEPGGSRGLDLRDARRSPLHGRGAARRDLAGLRAPISMPAPVSGAPPRVRWTRPRRVPPDDDIALA